MNKILLSLCCLTNLANIEYIELLGKLKEYEFMVGSITLGSYGIQRAEPQDPILFGVQEKILHPIDGQSVLAISVAELSQKYNVSLADSECIYYAEKTSAKIVADSKKSRTIFQELFTSTAVLSSLDIFNAGIKHGICTVDEAMKARAVMNQRTGILPENKYDYFIEQI